MGVGVPGVEVGVPGVEVGVPGVEVAVCGVGVGVGVEWEGGMGGKEPCMDVGASLQFLLTKIRIFITALRCYDQILRHT